MILETDASVIAGKVATHTVDADAPLSEQVMQLSIFLLAPPPLINKLVELNLSNYIKDKEILTDCSVMVLEPQIF